MKLKQKGTGAWDVQKDNRVEYIYAGKKYVGTVIKPLPNTDEILIQPDGLNLTHTVMVGGKIRRLKPSNKSRKMDYVIKHDIPYQD